MNIVRGRHHYSWLVIAAQWLLVSCASDSEIAQDKTLLIEPNGEQVRRQTDGSSLLTKKFVIQVGQGMRREVFPENSGTRERQVAQAESYALRVLREKGLCQGSVKVISEIWTGRGMGFRYAVECAEASPSARQP